MFSNLNLVLSVTPPPIPPIPIPDCLQQLGAMSSGLHAFPTASMAAQLSVLAQLNLPPLPISPATLSQLNALTPLLMQLRSGLGVSLASAAPRITAMATILDGLPLDFPLENLALPGLAPLASVLATINIVKSSLRVDLFAPKAAVHLQAALNARVAAVVALPIEPSVLSNLGNYLMMSNLIAVLGLGPTTPPVSLTASISAMAALQLPATRFNPMILAQILALLASGNGAQTLLGFNAVVAPERLAIALSPLQQLESVVIPPLLLQSAPTSQLLRPLMPILPPALGVIEGFQAIAKLDLAPLAQLPIPNLAPTLTASALLSMARVPSGCASSCPLRL